MHRKQTVKLEFASTRPLNSVTLIPVCFQRDTEESKEKRKYLMSTSGLDDPLVGWMK